MYSKADQLKKPRKPKIDEGEIFEKAVEEATRFGIVYCFWCGKGIYDKVDRDHLLGRKIPLLYTWQLAVSHHECHMATHFTGDGAARRRRVQQKLREEHASELKAMMR